MKKVTHNSNGKLQLKKQAIANLSKSEQTIINGGKAAEAAWTTSIGECTGWACCGATQTCSWFEDITKVAGAITKVF